jgi:hypothetical protein
MDDHFGRPHRCARRQPLSRRSRRRRRARILRVTDTRLLEDMGISSEMLGETLCEPRVRRAARPGSQLPPTDRPARHHF